MSAKGSVPLRAELRPLSARSVVLSLLLGAHPPELPVRELVRVVETFGISAATLRVALTRMTAAGDLIRTDTAYRLSDRLLERQRRQDAAVDPPVRSWDGDWELAVITATGRGAAERARLRADLADLRLAELREGLWLRPANLERRWPARLDPLVQRWTGRPDQDDADLIRALWDPETWAEAARGLLHAYSTAASSAERFTVVAAIFRHLLTDPVLPAELLPPDWPAPALLAVHSRYRDEMTALARTTT